MSIQNSTLHYHFPLVTGTDRPIFSDYNTAMQLLDELLYSAVSNVGVFAGQIAALQETSGEHTTELAELDTFQTEQEGINSANADRFLAINQTLANQAVTNNNKFNSVSIADAYDATRTYSVGDVVTYNGDRYRCITAVTTGEPFDADKWQGEDVQAVLDSLNSDLIKHELATLTDAFTVTANGYAAKTLNDMGYTVPTGYHVIALVPYQSSSTGVVCCMRSESAVLLRNVTGSDVTISTLNVVVILAKNV